MKKSIAYLISATLLLSGCGDDDAEIVINPIEVPQGENITKAAIATVASDYSSGSHAFVSGSGVDYTALNNIDPTTSDITMASGGNYFYRIGRAGGGNHITKFSFDAPQSVIWQYSVKDSPTETVLSNPSDMVVVNEQKAYVLRYGKPVIWIVNPSATNEADFKIGEIDLSAYSDSDGIPEMYKGVVAGNKLFVSIQRLVTFAPTETAYVAVIDINTDTEIDALYTGDSLKGIPLNIRNPNNDIMYVAEDNAVYIQGLGAYSASEYSGGIEKIDVDSLALTTVLDDGSVSDHPYGHIASLAVASSTDAYFIGCADCYSGGTYSIHNLFRLNPSTRQVTPITITGLQNSVLKDLAISPKGRLWVSAGNATVYVFEPASQTVVATIDTQLNPDQIVFAQ